MEAHGFRDSFTPLIGVLFTFPSRYWYTIGLTGVFSLAGWARRIQAGLLVPRPTQGSTRPAKRTRMGLSPAAAALSRNVTLRHAVPRRGPTTPRAHRYARGLGCSPVARHYWGNHCCFLFLGVLRCFSSPRLPPTQKCGDAGPPGRRVFPFGHPGVKGHLRLTRDFRSLSRPSSPP